MAGLRAGQAALTIGSPTYHGRCTVLGYARDWRPSEAWWGRQCEFIEPLGAVAPAARLALQDTALTGDGGAWAKAAGFADAWRTFQVAGNPACKWLEWGDGSVYTAGVDDPEDYTGAVYCTTGVPRMLLSFWRYPPPAGQGIDTAVIVKLPCEWWDGDSWEDGRVFLVFPLATAPATAQVFTQPFLCYSWTDTGAFNVQDCTDNATHVIGAQLKQFSCGGQASQEVGLEQWIVECEYDASIAPGSHLLLRNAKDPKAWQHYYNDNIRLVDASISNPIAVSVAGSVHYLNVSPLSYGDAVAECGPPLRESVILPVVTGSTWQTTAGWTELSSVPANWTVDTAKDADDAAGIYRPRVTMTRTNSAGSTVRPLVVYVAQENAPTVGDADATAALVEGRLVSCRYTMRADWRGSSGSAEFSITGDELGATWRRGGIVQVAMGQQTGCDSGDECAQIATAYIRPDGIRRWRNGEDMLGLPGVSLEFADFVQVRVAETAVVDMRQAMGRQAGEWYRACWARLGMPAAMVDVDASIESTVIQVSKLPSEPGFAAEDGSSWAAHFDAVCNVMGWRWGIDKAGDGKAFLDTGTPTWTPGGTPDIILDYDSAVAASLVASVEHATEVQGTANAVKAVAAQGLMAPDYYIVTPDTDRDAGPGHDYWHVVKADQSQDVEQLARAAELAKFRGKSVLRLAGPIRRAWRPDQFLRVDDCPGIQVEVGSVWQLVEVSHAVSGNGSHETTALAVWVAQEEVGE